MLELLTPRNVEEVVLFLKKEILKTQTPAAAGGMDLDKGSEYRLILVQAIHTCTMKFPEVASSVAYALMDFLGDSDVKSGANVINFLREIIETNPKLRASIIQRLTDTFYQIHNPIICARALWLLGECSLSLSEVQSALEAIKQCLGDLPLLTITEEGETADVQKQPEVATKSSVSTSSTKPVILADGTYATQTAATEMVLSKPMFLPGSLSTTVHLRSLILSGDFFVAAVLANTLTKLVLRLEEVQPSKTEVNKATTGVLLIMVSLLQLGSSSALPKQMDGSSYDKILLFVKLLCNTGGDEVKKILLKSCHESFALYLSEKQMRENEEIKAKAQDSHAQPDDLINFYHLKNRKVCILFCEFLVFSSFLCLWMCRYGQVSVGTFPSMTRVYIVFNALDKFLCTHALNVFFFCFTFFSLAIW